jgi:hypothetical protein
MLLQNLYNLFHAPHWRFLPQADKEGIKQTPNGHNIGGSPLYWPEEQPADEDVRRSTHIKDAFMESLRKEESITTKNNHP